MSGLEIRRFTSKKMRCDMMERGSRIMAGGGEARTSGRFWVLLLLFACSALGVLGANPLTEYVDTLLLNGQELVYDESGARFLLVVPEEFRGSSAYEPHVRLKAKDNYRITLNGMRLKDGDYAIFNSVSGIRNYRLDVYSGNRSMLSCNVQLTFLPIVEITTSSDKLYRDIYTDGTFRLHAVDGGGADSVCLAKYRIRGATSANYPKKSYTLKLTDETGEKQDRRLLGMRNDNTWFLEAMTIDKACLRNRLSMDLWNDYAAPPYYAAEEKKARLGVSGRFVEVFLNGSYNGLYCLTEKLDRKQLKLKKYVAPSESSEGEIHGVLYKATQWHWTTMMGHEVGTSTLKGTPPPAFDNESGKEEWLGSWEVKYPDVESERVDWAPLWEAINFCTMADDDFFYSNVAEVFDIPVLVDYWLLLEVTLAWDNDGKNMYYFSYDIFEKKGRKRLSIAPWDLDATWGRAWDGKNDKQQHAEMDYRTTRKASSGGLTYFNRLEDSNVVDWEEMLRRRYLALRHSGLFSADSLLSRLRAYGSLFQDSGADKREENRWSSTGYHTGIQADIDYIAQWIPRRIAALDKQYGYDPEVMGTADVSLNGRLQVEGGRGRLVVHAPAPCTAMVYASDGRLVRTLRLRTGLTTVAGLVAGIYIVEGRKVMVE